MFLNKIHREVGRAKDLSALLYIVAVEECKLLSCCSSSSPLPPAATIALTVFWDTTSCSLKTTDVSVESVALYYGDQSW